MKPYYSDASVSLYLGKMEDVLPRLDLQADAIVTDPPYKATSLTWDKWPADWPSLAAAYANSMWCFGSLRLFMAKATEFAAGGWKLSQDTVGDFEVDTVAWEKHNGSGFATDRFRNVHELAAHFYRGAWEDVYHETPRATRTGPKVNGRSAMDNRFGHAGNIQARAYEDDGTRLVRSVIKARNLQRHSIHPTQKPEEIVRPLIEYAVPEGGTVIDPFAGSCTTLIVARALGLKAIGIEGFEPYAERAAERLATVGDSNPAVVARLDVPDLFGGAA